MKALCMHFKSVHIQYLIGVGKHVEDVVTDIVIPAGITVDGDTDIGVVTDVSEDEQL